MSLLSDTKDVLLSPCRGIRVSTYVGNMPHNMNSEEKILGLLYGISSQVIALNQAERGQFEER